MLDLAAPVMRGPSYWTPGEREYLAMFTAQLHRCPYCVETHTELTRIVSAGEVDADDSDSVRPELAALLPFLGAVTTTPDQVSSSHLARARDLGVPDHGIVEALHVNLVWNTINRLANAFEFRLRDGQLETGTRALHRLDYRFPRLLTGRPLTTPARAESRTHLDRLVEGVLTSVFESPGADATGNPRRRRLQRRPPPRTLGVMRRQCARRLAPDHRRRHRPAPQPRCCRRALEPGGRQLT